MAVLDQIISDKIRAATRVLSRYGSVHAAYLFGSQVEGTADEWSDIDIAAFMDGIDGLDMKARASIAARVMIEVSSDVEVHLFPSSSLESPGRGSFAEYILNHGIRVSAETC